MSKYKYNYSLSFKIKGLIFFFNSIYYTLKQYKGSLRFLVSKYLYTINHKRIALNYLYFSLVSGLFGTFLASMIRFELATPGSHFFKGDSIRYLQVITIHALIMIFFVVIPIFFGFFANFFIPYHIGSKDVSFPRINSFGFWIIPSSFLLLVKLIILRPQLYKQNDSTQNLFTQFKQNLLNHNLVKLVNKQNKVKFDENFSLYNFSLKKSDVFSPIFKHEFIFNSSFSEVYKPSIYFLKSNNHNKTLAGWTYITPFSSKLDYTAFGILDLSIVSIIIIGLSSTLSVTNLLITRRTLGLPGLKDKKTVMPFLSISLFLVMRMLSLITPVLAGAMIMLLSDRHLHTSYFDYAYGGDVILFNHLFWFFGHPEVYVVIIPSFGIINMLIPFYAGKLLISKNHLIWATYTMAYMGFLVWGHHMYLVGLDHRARSLFSTITIMIALPAVIKIVNWMLTLSNSSLKINTQVLFSTSFLFFFLSGGLTGMWLSHVSLNIYIHDTFYVVAHFHFMFSASVFSAIFAGLFHYFILVFGFFFNKKLSYLMLICWNLGQWGTFVPLYWVGYNGLPRRYHDYNDMYSMWHSMSSHFHIFNILTIIFFLLIILESSLIKYTRAYFTWNNKRTSKRVNYYQKKRHLVKKSSFLVY